jgi:catechol 2,3-dioxygenase-like lactoylglutathione lyase family enzyme
MNSLSGETKMHTANLTRFGPQTLKRERGESTTCSATFRAIDGPAKLVLRSDGIETAQIEVNGRPVVVPTDLRGRGEVVVPLNLEKANTIEIRVSGGPDGTLGVRVTQITQADLGVLRQGYFGLNTSDMQRQRAFYETLGFIGEIYPAGPETSTSFARSLGFADNYLIHVSLHSLQDPATPPFVDTVQFRGDSYREEPPYANLNHIGMAYATYATSDLDGDYAYLRSRGVDFVSAPATAPNGERFVFLKDQDGAFLKLIATAEGERRTPGPNLLRLVNTNMNVTDLERSREFYRLIGFSESAPASQAGSGEFAAAHGFDGPIEFEGEDISLGEGTDGATIQLRRWKSPYDDAPPYPPPVNHLGIDRINFYVKDLTAVVRTMNELGFEQLGPIGGAREIGIVFFFDPDGIKVQFAGPQTD